jgi:hypothetical protein
MKTICKYIKFYFLFSLLLFGFSALTKLWSLIYVKPDVLMESDKLTGISYGALYWCASTLEIALVIYSGSLRIKKNTKLAYFTIIWFAALVMVYRFGNMYYGYYSPCECLGGLHIILNYNKELVSDVLFHYLWVTILIMSAGIICENQKLHKMVL